VKKPLKKMGNVRVRKGVVVREDDRKALLMGMAVLKTHDMDGKRHMPDG